MNGVKDYEDMRITKTVAEYMSHEEWNDTIRVSDDRSASTVETILGIEGQGYRLFLESNEAGEVFTVYMYSPFTVPANRIDATVKLLNRINRTRLRLGKLTVLDNGESSPIQFTYSIDVEGGSLSPNQIGTVVGICFSLSRFHQLLSAVALTKQSADKLWEDFVQEEERLAREQQEEEDPDESSDDEGPNKL